MSDREGRVVVASGSPRRSKTLVVTIAAAFAIGAAVVAIGGRVDPASEQGMAASGGGDRAVTPAPVGHKKYLVFMADGTLPSVEALFGNGEAFQRDVMKRTPAEIAANKREAIDFIRDRFGLDFSSGDSVEGVTLLAFALPTAVNYRAYTISGESVPATGWEVRDGGWAAIVGPGGATLHGGWGGTAGKWVPEGTALPFGEYSIAAEAPDGSPRDPIVFRYQGFSPVAPMVGSTPMFNCELISREFGRGQALGVYDVRPRVNGTVHMMARNVLTFT